MATLPTKPGAVTLTDFAKSIGPDGSVSPVIELLSQNNDALNDILWKEGNLPTGHQTTVRTGLLKYATVAPKASISIQGAPARLANSCAGRTWTST